METINMMNANELVLRGAHGPIAAGDAIRAEKATLLARIAITLIEMGATVEFRQWEAEHWQTGLNATIDKVNGVSVEIGFAMVKHERWERKPDEIKSIRVAGSYTREMPTASYPKDKHGQFNMQKLCERLDAVTRALVSAKEVARKKDNREAARRADLADFNKEHYGSEYREDYARGIKISASSEGFTVSVSRRVKDKAALEKLVADFEKFIDERNAS